MQMRLVGERVPTKVIEGDTTDAPDAAGSGPPTIRQIKERGVLRVGYREFRYPFSFFNDDGELVGFDIQLANQLASDLGVRLELVRYEWRDAGEQLADGTIDLTPNVPYLENLLDLVEYSEPVLTATAGFVVKDHRRHDFSTLESLQAQQHLTIGVTANPQLVESQLRAWLPDVALDLVELASPDDFFLSTTPGIDAFITTAEIGTAFTLLYPDFAVVVPKPTLWRLPLGFAAAKGNFALAEYLDGWVATHQQKGTFQRAYDHWILGEGAKRNEPRWSVVRNVLGWVD
jgi:ABC-type amino acid transport substrate-binding protein